MDKQQDILNAALHLFVEAGFHGTPTSRIAKQAGVANGTLFYYFKTKEELIVALYNTIRYRFHTQAFADHDPASGLRESLETAFTRSLDWAASHKAEFYFMQQFEASPYYQLPDKGNLSRQNDALLNIIRQGVGEGVLKHMPVELLSLLIEQQIRTVSDYLAGEADETHKKKIATDCFGMLWNMLS